MRGNETGSLAKHVKHHKHVQHPPLKDGCGRRKTLPSAMNSCLGLEPCHVLYILTLECPDPCWQLSLQASGNWWRKIQVFLESISERDCFSRKAPFFYAAAWFSLPSSYATLAFFSVWSIGAANITDFFQLSDGGWSMWKGMSISSHNDLENRSYTHVWGKKALCWTKTLKNQVLSCKNPKLASHISSWSYQNGALSITS